MAKPWRRAGRTLLILLVAFACVDCLLTPSTNTGESEGVVRRLKVITNTLDAGDGLYVHDTTSPTSTCYPAAAQPTCSIMKPLYAGMSYSMVEIRGTGGDTFDAPNARLKVVKESMTWANARNGQCQEGAEVLDGRVVPSTWLAGATTTPAGNKLKADIPLKFGMGGSYKICYSQDGSFATSTADIVHVTMQVNGMYDTSASCSKSDPQCLSHRKYQCYLRKQAFSTETGIYATTTSCIINVAYAGSGITGVFGKGSWSAEWTTTGYHESTGALLGLTESMCGTAPAEFICRDGGACDSGTPYITVDKPYTDHPERARFDIPTITDKLQGSTGPNAFKARTVHACYCPKGANCDAYPHFIQEVGVLHFYLSKVCHADDKTCVNDFVGVVPQYRFRVRVECPTNACIADTGNRIKLVEKSSANDKPSWDSLSGCGSALHGVIGGVQTLPPEQYVPIDGTAAGTVNQANCVGPRDCALNGGTRQDYKDFGGHFGFRFIMGHTVHEQRSFHSAKDVDVCYCNSGCGQQLNWFKVGGMKLSPTRLVSAATSRSNLPEQWNIQYMNQPGIVGLQRLYPEAGSLGLQENGLLKLVEDSDRTKRDNECALDGYNSQYTMGLANPVQASLNYLGKRQTATPPDLQKIVFNSNAFVNAITVTSPGSLAVCYCAITLDTMCTTQANWKLVTHLTIKGPKFNQRWTFSTNVVFRFTYEGLGLTSGDSLRIISPDGQCTDNNFNPNTAAWAYTGMRVNCPVPCNDVGTVSDPIKGDLSTIVPSNDNYKCSRLNNNCAINDIEKVEVLSETETEITFQKKHGLAIGEEITMGANIICKIGDTMCTPEMLAALKGVFDYGDADFNNGQAPNNYILPHKILSVPDGIIGKKARIRVGWPAARRPTFEIAFANANLAIGYIGRGGEWTMHSKGTTREEVMGSVERANLRVCWRFGGNGAKYVAEVGRLTIRNPAPLEGSTVSMSSTVRNNVAPMILTFKTSDGVTGLRYDQAEDSLRLKIVFDKAHIFDITYSDAAGTRLPELADVQTENEQEKGSQAVCGKLFLEVWSNDMTNGFPLPKACWYKTFTAAAQNGNPATLKSREVYMIFEAKSGFRKNTIYQLVFNGIVKEPTNGQPLPKIPLVVKGGDYLILYPMDDVTARPYEAIESGPVKLTSDPQVPPRDPADPKFRVPDGFKLSGGHAQMLELKSGDSLVAEIMGSPLSGAITKGNIIRVYLWPLLQWQTTSSCTAECLLQAEKSFLCGQIESCKGLPVVPGMSLNILKITLPEIWQPLYGDTKVKLKIGGITPPTGGFFAQRLGVQVTNADDQKPHYIHSVGDYIWKQPNEGTTVSKVVGTMGGGNIKPFRGDTDNTLYVRMILSSTIMGRRDLGLDASFTITLPSGYTCLDKNPTWTNGSNAWAVPSTLPAFGSKVPQGRGAPDALGSTHGWSVSGNKCTFTPFHPNGIIYAGSAIMFRVYADNPTYALTRTQLSNSWTVSMSNYGTHPTVRQKTDEYPFMHTGDPNYQPNYAALGRITNAGCQPTTFTPSARRSVEQELRFFFRSEQEVAAGGFVKIHAPSDFSFELVQGQPCNATNLANLYYANPADPADATLMLPGIVSCTTSGVGGSIASIALKEILPAGRIFGLKIWVKNPMGWTSDHSSGWRIFTLDNAGYLVDGTPGTVPFTASQGGSWGLYTSGTLQAVLLSISNMLPYSMLKPPLPATVKLVIHSVPTGNSGFVRFIAPDGYIWHFTPEQFVYQTYAQAPASHKANVPPAVTAAWPGGKPTGSGTRTLIWQPGQYMVLETYGFACFVKVPDSVPLTSSNSFFLEFGFNSTASNGRVAAMSLPAPLVRNLQHAMIDYTTSIKAKENVVQFRIQTVTPIPAGGGIEITAPMGFKFATPCELLQAYSPDAGAPPAGITCTRYIDTSAGPGGKPVIRLASSTGLASGIHQFAIIAENPAATSLNYASDTACGTYVCWVYKSFKNVLAAEPREELDLSTSAQGFSIYEKMLEARIPILTMAQRRGTNRDDRPKNPNNVIFAFKLSADASTNGNIMIRGPHGFMFSQTCLGDIAVSEATVFGLGNRFPPSYAVWPSAVQITQCFGEGRIANLTVTYGANAKLLRNQLYIFRVGLTSNPLNTPQPNRWVIEHNREASEPFEGMTLWAFTDTQLVSVGTAVDRTLAGAARTPNPLRISIRPFNDIPQGAYMAIQAPFAFQFKHLPSLECDAQLREIPYMELGVSYPGHIWPATGLTCLVTKDSDSAHATIRLRDPRAMKAGLMYILVVFVYNPRQIFVAGPTTWKISSFTANSLSLDESLLQAFSLNTVMNLWTYTNPEPGNPGIEVNNGGTALPAFSLQMRFPDTLAYGDLIVIEVLAKEFKLVDALGKCIGFRWIGANPFPNSPDPQCTHSNVTIQIQEPLPGVARDTLIEFGLNIVNPLKTPNAADNFWRCKHHGPAPMRSLKSSKSFESWTIIPQLEKVEVQLLGPGYAAEAISSMRVAFTAVNDAEDVAVMALTPPRFVFNGAKPVAKDQEVILAKGDTIRIRMKIIANVRYTIVLNGVQLGREGGQTDFKLTSWVGGMWQSGEWKPGIKRDEKLHYTAGFRLPGRTIMRYEKLENDYHKDSNTYPVQSLWEAQNGRPCYVEFNFQLTQPALVGTFLRLMANPYEPTMRVFKLQKAPPPVLAGMTSAVQSAPESIPAEVTSVRRNEFRAKLLAPLVPYVVYKVILSAIAPSAKVAMDWGAPITWSIDTLDGGLLPMNTNDGMSREFPIVEEYTVGVMVGRAPPIAEAIVTLHINPHTTIPTEIKVIAPKGFNFTAANCLVSGYPAITKCRPGLPFADGRSTAVLTTDDQGLRSPPQDLRIRVMTPRATPMQKAWFIEGIDVLKEKQLGWGEAAGFDIKNMSDISVTYPGVPGELGMIVWRFRTEVLVKAGAWLEISTPPELGAECYPGTRFEPITLPASSGCRMVSPGLIYVSLNSTIVPAEYSFAHYVIPPVDTPVRNVLSIVLKDHDGTIKDAAVDLPGYRIWDKLKIKAGDFIWDVSAPGRTSTITMGFTVTEPLPDNVVAPYQQVFTILITLPVGFIHLVQDVNDFQILNEGMPLVTPLKDSVDFMAKDTLRVYLNPNGTSWNALKAGDYMFRFPVLVPELLPAYNVWQVSLCRPGYGPCNRVSAPAVLINFAMVGFNFEEVWVEKVTVAPSIGMTTSSACGHHIFWTMALLLFTFCRLS